QGTELVARAAVDDRRLRQPDLRQIVVHILQGEHRLHRIEGIEPGGEEVAVGRVHDLDRAAVERRCCRHTRDGARLVQEVARHPGRVERHGLEVGRRQDDLAVERIGHGHGAVVQRALEAELGEHQHDRDRDTEQRAEQLGAAMRELLVGKPRRDPEQRRLARDIARRRGAVDALAYRTVDDAIGHFLAGAGVKRTMTSPPTTGGSGVCGVISTSTILASRPVRMSDDSRFWRKTSRAMRVTLPVTGWAIMSPSIRASMPSEIRAMCPWSTSAMTIRWSRSPMRRMPSLPIASPSRDWTDKMVPEIGARTCRRSRIVSALTMFALATAI